ncbi:15446_t:CDS:2 [Racocetra fulgida]|uniref:15446_t:CDS:1 n=1 Tax=Racocetra fulgida TaxID=60492 RepID=A0A9N9AHA7_9GLOM|nr:15446_t:CDS:2 [Racocetra fulgida]
MASNLNGTSKTVYMIGLSKIERVKFKQFYNDETSIYKSYKDTNQSSVNDISTKTENSNDVSSEVISRSENAPVSDIPENISNSDISSNTTNSDIYQESSSQLKVSSYKYSASLICTEIKSSEDKEIDEFLGSTYKEQVSNKIIQSIKEKKLRDQVLLSTHNNTPNILCEKGLIQEQCQEISITKNHEKSSNQISDMSSNKISEQHIELIDFSDKPLTNLIIEQKLQQQIAMSTGGNNSAMVVENSMQDINISINDLSLVSALTILLPDITDVNLRYKILKARKIRTLFSVVGIEKIRQVSYSANVISSLSYTQIQNIINYVNKRTSNSNIPLIKKTLEEDIITENSKSLLETEVGIPIESHISPKNYSEIKVSVLFNPTHDRVYFRNKILG